MNELIAVIDDEQDIAELIEVNLKNNGFAVKSFADGKAFFRFLKTTIPDLIVLDLMLPDINGLDICKQIKREPKYESIPIIMLTAKGDETDKLIGLEIGADDYMTKPFSPRELVARVKVVLRRKTTKENPVTSDLGAGIRIDFERFTATVNGKPVSLTTTEMKILELLNSKRGYVFSRDKILDHLWGDDKVVLDRTIDVHIKNLRDKLGTAGKSIKNIRGIGYKLL
ncbi:MAG: response regulator transcription factor [Endomicrobiales bacterium]|jgi:two-component system phosphate regulon response regulator PhoB/two-component system alkaline phosphatase synthesis response regulator PhoP